MTPVVLFRGQPDGSIRQEGGPGFPWWFSESYMHARDYARGTDPAALVPRLDSLKVLDLTTIDYHNPIHRELIDRLQARFADEGWTCRYSGEERHACDYLEAGDLYDYEGTGSGERWHALFSIALDEMGFDAVRAVDVTDGIPDSQGQRPLVWVLSTLKSMQIATPGEQLAAMIHQHRSLTPAALNAWLKATAPDAAARIEKLRQGIAVGSDRTDPAHRSIHGAPGQMVRPGDEVTFAPASSAAHRLRHVHLSDLLEDGGQVTYMPQRWRISAPDNWTYLQNLSAEQIRMLLDGENAMLEHRAMAIESIERLVMSKHNPAATGRYHGPGHWARVRSNALAVARSLGVDPLIPTLFALIHDSQRADDYKDADHGSRAAQWVQSNPLLSFLTKQQRDLLAQACSGHSMGLTEAPDIVRACWDADRLDLGRVGITPDPDLMCTPYGKSMAEHLQGADQEDEPVSADAP